MLEQRKIENFVMEIYLNTLESIVGSNGLKSILNYAHLEKYIDSIPPNDKRKEIPLRDLQAIFSSLYELFGQRGVRGLQLRVGRENARIGIEGRSSIAKPLMVATRLIPETRRMRLLLEKVVEQSNQVYTSQLGEVPVELQETEDYFLIIHKDRFESEGITSDVPVCNVFVGNLQHTLEWITGYPHKVEEIECRALGHPADVFRIEKVAIRKS
jgi:predicted hydrocarbon binding protein